MCRVLGVSESGYYRYIENKDKPGKDKILSVAMKEILNENPLNDNYGAPRMQMALNQRGIKAGKRRITRIMRENGWLHTPKRRPKGLTKADPKAMITENLIKQDFSANAPFEKLLTDITQIQCKDGKLYISPILDCYNGEILSLIMRSNMKKELCIDTVKALRKYPVNGAILHSDRGSQYTSEAFRETLSKMNIYQSVRRRRHVCKGDDTRNALKLNIHPASIKTGHRKSRTNQQCGVLFNYFDILFQNSSTSRIESNPDCSKISFTT